MRVVRLEDFKGLLALGLSGAAEVKEAVRVIADEAEGDFYTRLLGLPRCRLFFGYLDSHDPDAVGFAGLTRGDAERYTYCRILEASQDSAVALSGVFATDSATGGRVAASGRLARTWNQLCRSLRLHRAAIQAYADRLSGKTEGATKYACNKTYSLIQAGHPWASEYERGELLSETCVEVPEDMPLSYWAIRKADNTAETEYAVAEPPKTVYDRVWELKAQLNPETWQTEYVRTGAYHDGNLREVPEPVPVTVVTTRAPDNTTETETMVLGPYEPEPIEAPVFTYAASEPVGVDGFQLTSSLFL